MIFEEGQAQDDEGGDPIVGSVADEAAKLLGALQDWAAEVGGGGIGAAAQGIAAGLRSGGDHVEHGEECRHCPICWLISRARTTSPEVREPLAEALGALAQAATAALRQQPHGDPPHGVSEPERIDLDD